MLHLILIGLLYEKIVPPNVHKKVVYYFALEVPKKRIQIYKSRAVFEFIKLEVDFKPDRILNLFRIS